MRESDIKITVTLNDKNQPVEMKWTAEAQEGEETRQTKAMLLSLFDKETMETFKIDLWTMDMQVGEMDRLMFHTLRALTETYHKATKNDELASQMKSFVDHFGKYTKIIPEVE
jgi:gliding motility-associated protein GldC